MFIKNFNTTLEASGTLAPGANIQHLHTMVLGEALCQLDTLSSEVGSNTQENLTSIILCVGYVLFPVNALPIQHNTIFRGRRKLNSLKVRRCAVCLIDLNEYLAVFPGTK